MGDRQSPEPVEQIPAADWTDQDLLTRDGAGLLLDEEIEAERARVESAKDAGDDAATTEGERRLNRLIEIRRSLTERSDS
ncbi:MULTISPECIES: hypothetical protein [Gordonia]|uniref:Uncharacterized protein n=1 Tax=Gordonia amicalis TaxID=89053 RepID=A0ABU4DDM8_9ACTN|nr:MULTISPECIES: hypothetical protein [Gordonia]ATD72301.1 hypothetical protein CNO18_20585 [Gordonia sp. 1D]MCR8896001.1 hypothetical protein [Gordonia sp. GONU]MCZ4651558.1 hypothetical protein [Gordonia amicalis]MDJ0452591.1 hypothetical protein [Gordonia amicalis]MDV6307835.1 hypothetical protein [Gordonia amicalis]